MNVCEMSGQTLAEKIIARADERDAEEAVEADPAKAVRLETERIQYWLSVGAQPSRTVKTLLKKAGIDPTPGKKLEA